MRNPLWTRSHSVGEAEVALDAAEAITETTSVLARAARAAENLSASDEAVIHVLERHALELPRRTPESSLPTPISGFINGTAANGFIGPGNATNPSAFVFEQFFSNPVGVTRAGVEAFGVRVILDPMGALITAFPF